MNEAVLRVVFEKPGWFANDPRVVVALDGRTLHDGSFVAGFEMTVELDAGPHRLTTTARLDYSRFWGNFARKLDLRPE
jgi:hypothetical protein